MPSVHGHPIRVVARRTGLTSHVLRVWEKRYEAVTPQRTPTNRRLYSDADIERLALLHRATLSGRSIGQVAQLPTKKLAALVTADEQALVSPFSLAPLVMEKMVVEPYLESCLQAAAQLDAEALEETLTRASVALGLSALLERVVEPLLRRIGELWRDGALRIAHEHMASAVVRTFLGNLHATGERSDAQPCLVVATPAGQVHELGALLVATTAAAEGWRIAYLGANLPAEEIAGVAEQRQAKAVALSVVYPPDDVTVGNELKRLRHCLPKEIVLFVGGRAADGYRAVLTAIGAWTIKDLADFRTALESLRHQKLSGKKG